jgi:hypothetical protein
MTAPGGHHLVEHDLAWPGAGPMGRDLGSVVVKPVVQSFAAGSKRVVHVVTWTADESIQ